MGGDSGELAGLHLLVVEDDENGRVLLREFFTYFGAHVTVAGSARDAMRRLRQMSPDVVVADVRLKDRNASWLLREARALPCDAPFVAVTAYDYDERTLLRQGFSSVLRKPLARETLIQAVLNAAARRR